MNLSNIKKYFAPKSVKKVVTDPLAAAADPVTTQVANQITTDPLAATVTPITVPATTQVANQVTTDPLAADVTQINAPATTTAATTAAETTQPSLFSNTASGIGDAYTSTLQDALTGKMYDPFAAGSKEAMARAEANKRATTANQIAGAGFTGQGIGQQVAAGAEGDISKNRFSTLNDIEKARNESRTSALSEARAYGESEESIRQYEQNLTEEQRQFDTGQSNWQKNFDQAKSEYGDTQNWKAYETALATGSDADVIAAYKTATGKDLDPMAVSQYRGYYRSSQEQELAAGDVAIKTAQATLDTMKRTDAGTTLSSYLTTHLDADMSDPALASSMQKYWESLGNTGTVPEDWADQQIKAAKDVRLTTENGAFNYQVDQQVASGIYTAEQGELLKTFNSSQLTNFLVKDPTTGAVTFDTAAYLKSVDSTSDTTPPSGTTPGSTYVKDGKVYQADSTTSSTELTFNADDPWDEENSKILKAGEEDNPYYKTIMDARYKEVTNDGKLLTEPEKWGDLKKNEDLKNLTFDDPLIQKLKTELESYSKDNPITYRGVKTYFHIVKDGNSWNFTTSSDK